VAGRSNALALTTRPEQPRTALRRPASRSLLLTPAAGPWLTSPLDVVLERALDEVATDRISPAEMVHFADPMT
jgi:hypothetical protein